MTTTETRRWTVAEFQAASEQGLVGYRSELVEGEVWEHVPPGPRHADAVDAMAEAFDGARRLGLRRRTQQPLVAGVRSQPEPDVALVRRRPEGYGQAHPAWSDCLLAVEVAHSSLRQDTSRKVPVYAEAGVPELWLVDLVHDVLVRHREPSGRVYGRVERLTDGLLAPEAAPDLVVDVADLLRH